MSDMTISEVGSEAAMSYASRKMNILRPEEVERNFSTNGIEQQSISEQDKDWQYPQIEIAKIRHQKQ